MYQIMSIYDKILNKKNFVDVDYGQTVVILDHLNGFDANLKNSILDCLSTNYNDKPIYTEFIFDSRIKKLYSSLDLRFSSSRKTMVRGMHFKNYKNHPEVRIKNFLCSFNGSDHVSRKLLTACLHKMKLFNPNYCSKNYTHSLDSLDGYITDYVGIDDRYYRKFFISKDSENFFQTLYSFGHVRFDHANNIYNLEKKLTKSFVHIVSETIGTSYYPFVTEKFLYSIVTRGLFVAYAQPGWHQHLEKYFGFKRYTKLFDYQFDAIENPIERLISLIEMIYKFKSLSNDEWYDLYLMEQETIEYNYDHYFSGRYLEKLKQYDD